MLPSSSILQSHVILLVLLLLLPLHLLPLLHTEALEEAFLGITSRTKGVPKFHLDIHEGLKVCFLREVFVMNRMPNRLYS